MCRNEYDALIARLETIADTLYDGRDEPGCAAAVHGWVLVDNLISDLSCQRDSGMPFYG